MAQTKPSPRWSGDWTSNEPTAPKTAAVMSCVSKTSPLMFTIIYYIKFRKEAIGSVYALKPEVEQSF